MRLLGLVAAAGASGRMGSPKALLSTRLLDDVGPAEPWVRRLARAMRDGGASDVVVTVPDDAMVAAAIRTAVADVALTAVNPRPASGLTGSVIAALDTVDADALVLSPVDAPGLTPATVRALRDAIEAGAVAAVVVHAGVSGHPVAFSSSCFAALRAAGERGGPRAVLATVDVARVVVDDPTVLWDLNSPADLARARR